LSGLALLVLGWCADIRVWLPTPSQASQLPHLLGSQTKMWERACPRW